MNNARGNHANSVARTKETETRGPPNKTCECRQERPISHETKVKASGRPAGSSFHRDHLCPFPLHSMLGIIPRSICISYPLISRMCGKYSTSPGANSSNEKKGSRTCHTMPTSAGTRSIVHGRRGKCQVIQRGGGILSGRRR
jgi:hypothetical protein